MAHRTLPAKACKNAHATGVQAVCDQLDQHAHLKTFRNELGKVMKSRFYHGRPWFPSVFPLFSMVFTLMFHGLTMVF